MKKIIAKIRGLTISLIKIVACSVNRRGIEED